MDKIEVIALKTFSYDGEVKTDKSKSFEVYKDEFNFFHANGMIKEVSKNKEAPKATETDNKAGANKKATNPNQNKKR